MRGSWIRSTEGDRLEDDGLGIVMDVDIWGSSIRYQDFILKAFCDGLGCEV